MTYPRALLDTLYDSENQPLEYKDIVQNLCNKIYANEELTLAETLDTTYNVHFLIWK